MIAALLRNGPFRCRSRQFTLALSFPPTNHSANGGFQTQTFFHGRNQVSSSLAALPQNLSGFFSEALCSFLYFLKVPMRAALAKPAEGLKTRFSFNIESMFVTALAGAWDDGTAGL